AVRLARKGFQVTGIDVSSEALNLARSRAKKERANITWREGFAEKLPFSDKSFDYITCCHTFEHVKDVARAVKQFKRVARKKIVILVPKQKFRLYMENYHVNFFENGDQLAQAIGLKQFQVREVNAIGRDNDFQGKALLYVGTPDSPDKKPKRPRRR
ncbi:MAG: class I SAM-dependent methyltransferase, partial [Bacteroidota bacterium]